MTYLDRLKRLENGDNFQYIPIIEPSKPSKAPFEPIEGLNTGLYVKNISANDSQPIAELVVVEIASKPNALPDRQVWKPDRCNRCIYISRFLGGNACRTDNGLPHLFGLLHSVPDDNGATCARWLCAVC